MAARQQFVEPEIPPPPGTAEPVLEPHPIEIWISHVLRSGVLLAGAIVFVGIVIFLFQGQRAGRPTDVSQLAGGDATAISVSFRGIVDGVSNGDPLAIMQLGLLVLILTPVVRVAMTLGLFVAQRDLGFIVITTIVLLILIISLFDPIG